MPRPRSFDEDEVVATAAGLFARVGFAATSVDDLVQALGMHRGSLYQAFGSKRGVFVAALRRTVSTELPPLVDPETPPAQPVLDLLLVAALELAADDPELRELVAAACGLLHQRLPPCDRPAHLLGRRLLARGGLPVPTSPQPA